MSRTTLDMDPELYEHLRELAHQRRTSLKAVVNELLWSALPLAAEPPPPPYQPEVFTSGFTPGVDPERLNQLVDELEAEGR